MAKNKKQHFVPQFYMRNFALDAEKKRIALFLIGDDTPVPTAAIRDQAYEDYFYGTGGVEGALSRLEGRTSPIIADAIAKHVLPEQKSEDHLTLLTFALFQSARTPVTATGMNKLAEKLLKTLAKDIPDVKERAEAIQVNDRRAPVIALQALDEIRHFATDLRLKLLENKARRLFITSDNPAVRYNQFLEKNNAKGGNTGIQCIGLQIFLPLDSRHLLMIYDDDVYRVGGAGRKHFETHIEITEADVAALNVLQAANADEVLYYSPDTDLGHVREAIALAKPYRSAERVSLTEHLAIGPDGRPGKLLAGSDVDLQIGLVLDCAVVRGGASGRCGKPQAAYLRNPDQVARFQEARMQGPHDIRRLVESFLSR